MRNLLKLYLLLILFSFGSGLKPGLAQMPGDVDTTFGTKGKASVFFSNSPVSSANDVLVQADGKYVLAGFSGNLPPIVMAIARLNSDGSLDTGFGTGGKVSIAFGMIAVINAVAQQSDGKLVFVGRAEGSTGMEEMAVIRLNTDGSLDTSFSADGKVLLSAYQYGDEGHDIWIDQNTGLIYVAGYASNSDFLDEVFVYCLKPDGSVEFNFGSKGCYLGQFSDESSRVLSIFPNPGTPTHLYMSGYSSHSVGSDSALLIKMRLDGYLDTVFANKEGYVKHAGSSHDTYFAAVKAFGNRVVCSGRTGANAREAIAVAYKPDGTYDNTFGTSGTYIYSGAAKNDISPDVLIMGDNSLVLAVETEVTAANHDFLAVKLKSDGSIDNGWGNSGLTQIDFNTSRDQPNALAIDNAGRLMMAGGVRRGNSFDFGLTRLLMPSTGIGALGNGKHKLSVYPNPCSGTEVRIMLPPKAGSDLTLSLYDARAKKVMEKRGITTSSGSATSLGIDVSLLSNGIYLIELTGSNGTYSGTLMLSK